LGCKLPEHFSPGETIAIRAKISPPRRASVPGSFDYAKYLSHQKIYLTGFVRSPALVQKALPPQGKDQLRYKIEKLRHRINAFIDTTLSGEIAAVYKAILTGDKGSLSQSTKESFIRSGTMHLLAISGLHVSLLGSCLFFLLWWLIRRSEWLVLHCNTKKTAILLSLPPLMLYTLMAGGKAPVLRAFIMSGLVILAFCGNKKHTLATLIACAAILILFISPDALFTVSFQLTFTAIISLSAAIPYITAINKSIESRFSGKLFASLLKWSLSACIVSLAASLGTAPLLLYHFNRISLIGVFTTFIIEPLLGLWGLTLGFIAILLLPFSNQAAELVIKGGSLGVQFAVQATSFFANFPYSSIYLPTPTLTVCVAALIFYLMLLWLRQISHGIRFLLLVCYLFCLTALILPPEHYLTTRSHKESITFLNVGHGSCTCLTLSNGKTVLVDAGALSSPGYDVGQRLIAPFLFNAGIRKIDHIIVTHPDSDHYNGVPFLLQNFNVRNLWVSTLAPVNDSWSALLKLAEKKEVVIHDPQNGEYIEESDQFTLQVLCDTSDIMTQKRNNGLVLKFQNRALAVLFPGDIESQTEAILVERGFDITADVLLAAHHGSKTSNSRIFLDKVDPSHMVISANKFSASADHQSSRNEYFRREHITLLPLFDYGTVEIQQKKEEYHIDTPLSDKLRDIRIRLR